MKFTHHSKSYTNLPVGIAGKDFKYQFIDKKSLVLGGNTTGPEENDAVQFVDTIDFYKTATNCLPIKPATLLQLVFDDAPATVAASDGTNAKYPEMFYYRYVYPVYYSVEFIVRRCRVVFDTDESHTSFDPSAADLLVTEQTMDFPFVMYWRADLSNLANFDGDALGKGFYRTKLPVYQDWMAKPLEYYDPGASTADSKDLLFNSLVNRRWKKCTVYPKQNCGVKLGVSVNSMAPTGKLPDTKNTNTWSTTNWEAPVSRFLRQFWNDVGISGQTEMWSLSSFPGDLLVLFQQPEMQQAYLTLLNQGGTDPAARARVFLDYEVKTQLVVRGLERHYNAIKFGNVVPN